MKTRKKCFLLLLPVILLFSFRKLFFLPNDYVLGHNWDWTFPAFRPFFNNLNAISKFTWARFNLGNVSDLNVNHLLPDSLLAYFSYYLEPSKIILLLLSSVVVIAFFSFKKLLDYLVAKSELNYLPSFLYAFSPFLFNEIIGGSWYMWISCAFIPLYFLNFIVYVYQGKSKNLFLLLFFSIFVLSSLQNFILVEFLLIAYLLFKAWSGKLKKRGIYYFLIAHLVLLVLNLYWVLPFGFTILDFSRGVSSSSFVGTFESVEYSTQDILNILNLSGYLDRNMYYFSLPRVLSLAFRFSVLAIWVAILLALFIKKTSKLMFFWTTTLFIFIFLIKGGNLPFPDLTMWFYNHIVFMRLYRSPQHLMFSAAFIIPILIAYTLRYFYFKFKQKNRIIFFFSLLIIIWLSGWWYSGDFGHKTLKDQRKDYIDFYKLSPDLTEIYQDDIETKRDERVLFLPISFSPLYLKNEYQNTAQGGQAEYLYLKRSTLSSELDQQIREIENHLCWTVNDEFINFLSKYSIKKIFVRSDIFPRHTESMLCWSNNRAKEVLAASDKVGEVFRGEYTIGYEVKEQYYLPRIYTPLNFAYVNKNTVIGQSFNKDKPRLAVYKETETKQGLDKVFNGEKIIFAELSSKSVAELTDLRERNPLAGSGYPFVRHKPGSLAWRLVYIKELFNQLEVGSDKIKLIETNLFYANKRISEVLVFGPDLDSKAKRIVFNDYENKIGAVIDLIHEIENGSDREKEISRTKRNIENNWYFLDSLYPNSDLSNSPLFRNLLEKINQISQEVSFDYQNLVYNFSIPEAGDYSLFIKNNIEEVSAMSFILDNKNIELKNEFSSQGDWVLINRRFFNQGDHELIVRLQDFKNLLEKNTIRENLKIFSAEISDYKSEEKYFISFDYIYPDGNLWLEIIENNTFDNQQLKQLSFPVRLLLPRAGKDMLRHFEGFFSSSPLVPSATLYFYEEKFEENLSNLKISNLKVIRTLEPEIVLSQEKNQNLTSSPKNPIILFKRVNPTKYRIQVRDALDPYILVFNENFNNNWKVYVDDKESSDLNDEETVFSYFLGDVNEGKHTDSFLGVDIFETFRKRTIADDRHYLVNGYANSWQINPGDVDGRENYELIIEFLPQRYLYIGLLISTLTLAVVSCLALKNIFKKE